MLLFFFIALIALIPHINGFSLLPITHNLYVADHIVMAGDQLAANLTIPQNTRMAFVVNSEQGFNGQIAHFDVLLVANSAQACLSDANLPQCVKGVEILAKGVHEFVDQRNLFSLTRGLPQEHALLVLDFSSALGASFPNGASANVSVVVIQDIFTLGDFCADEPLAPTCPCVLPPADATETPNGCYDGDVCIIDGGAATGNGFCELPECPVGTLGCPCDGLECGHGASCFRGYCEACPHGSPDCTCHPNDPQHPCLDEGDTCMPLSAGSTVNRCLCPRGTRFCPSYGNGRCRGSLIESPGGFCVAPGDVDPADVECKDGERWCACGEANACDEGLICEVFVGIDFFPNDGADRGSDKICVPTKVAPTPVCEPTTPNCPCGQGNECQATLQCVADKCVPEQSVGDQCVTTVPKPLSCSCAVHDECQSKRCYVGVCTANNNPNNAPATQPPAPTPQPVATESDAIVGVRLNAWMAALTIIALSL